MLSFDLTITEGIFDHYTHEQFVAWRIASEAEDRIAKEVNEDKNHPSYIEAQKVSDQALIRLLTSPTKLLHGTLLKLKTAAIIDGSTYDALDGENRLVAPRAIVAAIHDIEHILYYEVGRSKLASTLTISDQ